MDSDTKKPNRSLRYYRENRGWSQQKLAELVETSEDMVSRWERGVTKTSPYYRVKLCTLFGKTAEELGFLEQEGPKVSDNIPVDDTTELLRPLKEHLQCAWTYAWGLGEQDFLAKGMEDQASAITGLLVCFEPKKELADPWKLHE